ncbi:MAG: LytTR family transcriptional regulator [Lachnospiraceae bacterium]|nr:LytTR family transcriptional regulator [Lachnospiraceae bacterium]
MFEDNLLLICICCRSQSTNRITPSFHPCHFSKSYIVNLSKITRIEPYGRWTYVAKFRGCELSALMTAQKYEEMKRLFS